MYERGSVTVFKSRGVPIRARGFTRISACAIFLASLPLGAAAPTSSIATRVLASRPGGTLSFTVGDDVRVFEVSRDALVGDDVELRRYPGHLRGRVGSEPVDLALAPPRITGQLGDHAVSLDMIPVTDGIQVAGRFGAREVVLHVRMQGIDGATGPCAYHLKPMQSRYQGDISCGGEPEQVQLEVPVALVARSDVEVAAMLVAVLAR